MKDYTLTMLLADDDLDDCMLFNEALEEIEMPTNLTVVHDGEQLMDYFISNINHLPDALFLDLNMPKKNGISCLKEIQLIDELKELPVFIFSTSYQKEIEEYLSQNGAKYFIKKPNEFNELKHVLQLALTILANYGTSNLPLSFLLNEELKSTQA